MGSRHWRDPHLLRYPLGIRGQICCALWKKYGPIGGYQETSVIPGEPDVLDGGDVVEGVVGDGLASGCRVRRVV